MSISDTSNTPKMTRELGCDHCDGHNCYDCQEYQTIAESNQPPESPCPDTLPTMLGSLTNKIEQLLVQYQHKAIPQWEWEALQSIYHNLEDLIDE